jgi:hypothetical protein
MNEIELNDTINEAASHSLLCQYDGARITGGNRILVYGRVISEESDIVVSNPECFTSSVEGDSIYSLLGQDFKSLSPEFRFLTIKEQLDLIINQLTGKMMVVHPYYNCKDDVTGEIYKNGALAQDDFYDIGEDEEKEYFTIPRITEEEKEKLLKKQFFKLPGWDKEVFGTPHYIFAGNKLFQVDLNPFPNSNMIYQQKQDTEIGIFDVNYNLLEKNHTLIQPYTGELADDYIFLCKDCLISLSKEEKEIAPIVVATQESVEEKEEAEEDKDIKYEVSETAKDLLAFREYMVAFNLVYEIKDIYNFHTCLRSSELTILAGMSGTGKTKLPLKYAEYFNMTEKDGTLLFVPVSPSFTEPSDLLGFYNPNSKSFVPSETGLTEFLIHADKNPKKMHMVIFDEMNLSPIEYYFASFLSVLEKDPDERYLSLYSSLNECANKKDFPNRIHVGTNVLFVGTINLDETTKNLSDRLLDRSFVINLKRGTFTDLQVNQPKTKESNPARFHTDLITLMPGQDYSKFAYISKFDLRQLSFLDDVNKALGAIDSQKGVSYRCAKNIAIYLENMPDEFDKKSAFDYAFKQTVMKKINGTAESIGDFLGELHDDGSITGKLIELFDAYKDVSDFTECREEVRCKILECQKYGYVR